MVHRIRVLSLSVAICFASLRGVAGEFQDDLKARRGRAMERLGQEAMLVLWSAPAQVYSRDINYKYRQDSNLYYLTGIDQEQTILILMPGNKTRKEVLFIRPRDPVREHWEGRRLSVEDAKAQSGIETIYLIGEFDSFIEAILAGMPYRAQSDRFPGEYEPFFKALTARQARLALVLEPRPGLSGSLSPVYQFANRVKERYFGVSIEDATKIFRSLRQIKTPYEQKILERSVEISSDAHLAGMRTARPGAYEYEVEAAIEQVHKASGCSSWGYPSIVGSGPNATVLHYSKSTRKMEPGDLLLVDAAANYEYLTGDITRTYPVGGSFTRVQKDIYEIVFRAQHEAMKVARAGSKTSDVHAKTVEIIKEGLLNLGLITDVSGDQYRTWYTHGSVHFIGMDVHDVGDSENPLVPGVAFVIEPGIYVREGALESLPKTPENAAFVEKVRPAFEKYKNIGIRIEDSFLLTETGLKHLSRKVPRTIDEIEKFMRSPAH